MPEPARQRRVLAVVRDLFLSTRIVEIARQLGVRLAVEDPDRALAFCREDPPDLVVLDLEAAPDMAAVVHALKHDPATAGIPLAGFYPHVRRALRDAALAAGLDQALPRSALAARLPALLGGPPPGGSASAR